MTVVNVAAFDVGLGTCGFVLCQLGPGHVTCVAADAFESKPYVNALDMRSCDDMVRRARELSRWLAQAFGSYDVQVVAAEALGYPRSAHAVACVSMAWGVLADQIEQRRLRLVTASASRVRTHLLGKPPRRGGSRKERADRAQLRESAAHAAAVKQVPSFVGVARRIQRDLQVHALDALCVFAWASSTDLVRAMVMR